MYQVVLKNLRKTLFSILPIIILVSVLALFFKIESKTIIRFLSSSIIVIFGLTLFTTGAEKSLNVMGDAIGEILLKKKKLWLILMVSLIIGTFITILEPEFLTLSLEAKGIPKGFLLVFVALGIGISLMLAIYRILKKVNFRYVLISGYLLIFLLLMISDFNVIPFSFDMSSVTAGCISAPFILGFGVCFSKKKKNKQKEHSEFGILSLCGLGPILMILFLGFIFHPNIVYDSDPILKRLDFLSTLWMNFYQVLMTLIPLVLLYLIFVFKKNKYKKEFSKILFGLIMVLIGITLFLTGGDVGFFKIAYELGTKLGNVNHIIILLIGGIINEEKISDAFSTDDRNDLPVHRRLTDLVCSNFRSS